AALVAFEQPHRDKRVEEIACAACMEAKTPAQRLGSEWLLGERREEAQLKRTQQGFRRLEPMTNGHDAVRRYGSTVHLSVAQLKYERHWEGFAGRTMAATLARCSSIAAANSAGVPRRITDPPWTTRAFFFSSRRRHTRSAAMRSFSSDGISRQP